MHLNSQEFNKQLQNITEKMDGKKGADVRPHYKLKNKQRHEDNARKQTKKQQQNTITVEPRAYVPQGRQNDQIYKPDIYNNWNLIIQQNYNDTNKTSSASFSSQKRALIMKYAKQDNQNLYFLQGETFMHANSSKSNHNYQETELAKIRPKAIKITGIQNAQNHAIKTKIAQQCKNQVIEQQQQIDWQKFTQGEYIKYIENQLKQQLDNKALMFQQKQNILAELKQALVNQQKQRQRWQKQKIDLQIKLNNFVVQAKMNKRKIAILQSKISQLSNQNKKLQHNWINSGQLQQLKDNKNVIEQHASLVQKLTIQIKNKDHQILQSLGKLEQAQTQNAKLRLDNTLLLSQKQQQEQKCKKHQKLTIELQKMELKYTSLQKEHEKRQDQNNKLINKIQQLNNDINKIRKCYENQQIDKSYICIKSIPQDIHANISKGSQPSLCTAQSLFSTTFNDQVSNGIKIIENQAIKVKLNQQQTNLYMRLCQVLNLQFTYQIQYIIDCILMKQELYQQAYQNSRRYQQILQVLGENQLNITSYDQIIKYLYNFAQIIQNNENLSLQISKFVMQNTHLCSQIQGLNHYIRALQDLINSLNQIILELKINKYNLKYSSLVVHTL